MDTIRVGGMIRWKMDRPGQLADASIATAVHQTPDSSKDITQSDTRGEDVSHLPERQGFKAGIKDKGQGGTDQASVVDETPMLNHKDLVNRFASELFMPIGNYIQSSGAENGTDNEPWTEIQDSFGGHSIAEATPACCP